MAKVRNLSDTQQEIAFTEFDFYQRYVESFKASELGRIVRVGRREAEESENEARQKAFLHTRGQGGIGVLEDVCRLVGSEADGGSEWKHPLSDLLRDQDQS